jgi:FdhD protein
VSRVTSSRPVVHLADGRRTTRPEVVVAEEPLEMRLGDRKLGVTMRTPGDDFDLAIGHLLTEALLHSATEVGTLMHCTDLDEDGSPTFNVVDVTLAPGAVLHRPARARTETVSSACGVCGSATIDAVRTNSRFAVADDTLAVEPRVLAALPAALRERQAVFDRTGGVHAAGLFTAEGERLVVREDVGRHNAVDKVTGARVLAGLSPAEACLVVSGRAGFELVQKAVAAGVGSLVAVGAPTSLAVSLAREARLALFGFTSPTRTVQYA